MTNSSNPAAITREYVGVEPERVARYLTLRTGVTGYLERQELLNRRALGLFAGAGGLSGVAAAVLDAGKFATAAELEIRKHQGRQRVGWADRRTKVPAAARRYNARAIRNADGAHKQIRAIASDLPATRVPKRLLRERLDDSRDQLILTFSKHAVGADELEETVAIFDEIAEVAMAGGVPALVDRMDQAADEFIRVRKRADRGTEHRSEIAWWKYLLAVLIIGGGAVMLGFAPSGQEPDIQSLIDAWFELAESGC